MLDSLVTMDEGKMCSEMVCSVPNVCPIACTSDVALTHALISTPLKNLYDKEV